MTGADGQAARVRAVAAFDLALARWLTLPGTVYPSQVLDEDQWKAKLEDLALRCQVTAVEAFTWARTFHDIASGKDGFTVLGGYPPLNQLPLMQAARFVANKGIHVMAQFSEVTTVPTIGGYARGPYGGGMHATIFRWVDEDSLPPITPREDLALRAACCGRWAAKPPTPGSPVVTALREVEDWIHRW